VADRAVLLCLPVWEDRKIHYNQSVKEAALASEDGRKVDRIMDPPTQTSPPPPGRLPTGELDLTGRTLGDFHVLRHLGQGGMGHVYLAEQISLKRKVALKILRPQLAADPSALPRFKAEATAVAQLSHANIVQVYAIGETEGVSYMALEYVEGRNLREYLAKKGPPDLLLALSIMRQVASALQRAGELGIVHRDIKPENILLTRKGEVKVADFGLSRCLAGDGPALNLTQSGVTMGTPIYMSPEQVEGKPVDCRTDIYSLGVTCYHMLAGHPPFQGNSPFEIALQHVRTEAQPLAEVRPDLPAPLCAMVHKMMAKDPAQRYQTGRELLKDIARLREGLSGQTAAVASLTPSVEMVPVASTALPETVSTGATLSQKTLRRWGWLRLAFIASVLLATAAGVGIGWFRHRLAFPLHAALVPPLEDGKAALPEKSEEEALRTVVEPYLNSTPNDGMDAQVGQGLCMKLGVFYLEHDRLEDALELFSRLHRHRRQNSGYRMLGQVGHAIVLALQNHPHEFNKLLQELGRPVPNQPTRTRFDNLQWMWRDKTWCYWMRKALHYNLENGLKREDIPAPLRRLL
jgi:serine/threonine-protein kinase